MVESLPSLKGRCKARLRLGTSQNNKADGTEPAVTDNGNYIIDLEFSESIKDAKLAAQELKNTVGVVEHGLFIGMASAALVGRSGGVELLQPTGSNL